MFASATLTELVRDGYVAPLPVIARKRISERYACELTISGCDIPGVATIRDLIKSIDQDLRFARALLISAPHTHWGEEMIVESYDATRGVFLNGPNRGSTAGELRPVSFVFSERGAVAYEWADSTVPFRQQDLNEIYQFISITPATKH